MPEVPTLIIEYAPPAPVDYISSLRAMMRWRSRCGSCLFPLVFLMPLGAVSRDTWPSLLIAGLFSGTWLCMIGTIVASICTLVYMGKAAVTINSGYAVRRLVLAVILSPIFLLGICAIPLVVRNDLLNRRRRDAQVVRMRELEQMKRAMAK